MRSWNLVVRAAALAVALIGVSAQAAVPRYRVQGIGSGDLPGQAYGFSLNNLGQVAGYTLEGSSRRIPFIYQNGHTTRLSALDGVDVFSIASLNDRGDLGGSLLVGSSFVPFVYRDGQVRNLGPVLGARHGQVYSINQAGHAVGYFYAEQGGFQSFYYDGKSPQVFSNLDLSFVDINDHDVIVYSRNYIIDHGNYEFVPQLSGKYNANNLRAINNSGQVVGRSYDFNGSGAVPFLYSDGVISSLGLLGGEYGEALDINDKGWVVGYGETQTRDVDAFLYRDGGLHNLEQLLVGQQQGRWDFAQALKINDRGQVLVELERDSVPGFAHALLTPVPEAQTWALLLAGLGVVGAAARRQPRRGTA